MAIRKIDRWGLAQLGELGRQLMQFRTFRDPVYQEVAELINPDMSEWFSRADPEANGVAPNTGRFRYDTTAQESSNLCAEGVMGYAISRDTAWFRFEFEDEATNEQSGAYIQLAERQMYRQLQRSAFYDEAQLAIRSLFDFGTMVMWRQENAAKGVPSYKTLQLSRCVIGSDQWGDVDVLRHEFWLSPQDAIKEFGADNLPRVVTEAARLNRVARHKFLRYVFPRGKYNLGWTSGKRWETIVVMDSAETLSAVQAGGYDSKPFYAARYTRSYGGGPWGSGSPGLMMLSVQRELNAMAKDATRLRMRKANPPIKASLGLYGKLRRTPGDATYIAAGEDYVVETVKGELQGLDIDMERKREQIKAAYHMDFFLVLTNNIEAITHSTATGVQGLQGEKAALLSAFFSRLGYEFLEPVLQDLFTSELEAGRIPTPPVNVQGKQAQITFISPLFQMQRQALVLNQTKAAMIEIGSLAQMQISVGEPPDVMDNFNLSKLARDIAKTYSVSADIVRDMIDVERIRQGRAQAAAQAAQQQQAANQAKMQKERALAMAATTKATGTIPLPGTGAQVTAAQASGGQGAAG